jgi:hypothetical protein
MFLLVLPYIVLAVSILLYLTIAVLLLRQYLRTRNSGFIWLGVATILWPLAERFLDRSLLRVMHRSVTGQPLDFFPFNLAQRWEISRGDMLELIFVFLSLIGASLLLVAVLSLCKSKNRSNEPSNAQS